MLSPRPYDVRLWQAEGICYEEIGRLVPYFEEEAGVDFVRLPRLREAIECFKRALISADPHEITLHLRIAKIHRTLEEYAESVAYHRGVVEVCQADCELHTEIWCAF